MNDGDSGSQCHALSPSAAARDKIADDDGFPMPGAQGVQHAVNEAYGEKFPDGTPVSAFHSRYGGCDFFAERFLCLRNERDERSLRRG